jgi:hypothetical protein
MALSGFSMAAEKPDSSAVAFQIHDGYFVSNQFEPGAPTSFVVLKDQAAFDQVFGVAHVMRDKSQRLAADAFPEKIVVAAIHRGKALVTYQVEHLVTDGKTLSLRYTTKSAPADSAEYSCPLIVSLPKGDYQAVQIIEDGKEIKPLATAAPFKITSKNAGSLTTSVEGERTIFSIKGPGIGDAKVQRLGEAWPKEVVLRVYLGGLENFTISSGEVKLSTSVLSHSGNQQLSHLWKEGKEGPSLDEKSPFWMEIHRLDATGKPAEGLPPKGGWFEMTLPQALIKESDTIELGWIDFYR